MSLKFESYLPKRTREEKCDREECNKKCDIDSFQGFSNYDRIDDQFQGSSYSNTAIVPCTRLFNVKNHYLFRIAYHRSLLNRVTVSYLCTYYQRYTHKIAQVTLVLTIREKRPNFFRYFSLFFSIRIYFIIDTRALIIAHLSSLLVE